VVSFGKNETKSIEEKGNGKPYTLGFILQIIIECKTSILTLGLISSLVFIMNIELCR
jgi:hypothetical protein